MVGHATLPASRKRKAAEKGHLAIVKLLAERGTDSQARNAAGKTPAEVTAAKGDTAAAEYLESLE